MLANKYWFQYYSHISLLSVEVEPNAFQANILIIYIVFSERLLVEIYVSFGGINKDNVSEELKEFSTTTV